MTQEFPGGLRSFGPPRPLSLPWARAGFLGLGTAGWDTLIVVACAYVADVDQRPGLYLLGASCTPYPAVTTKNVPRYFPKTRGWGAKSHCLRTTGLDLTFSPRGSKCIEEYFLLERKYL